MVTKVTLLKKKQRNAWIILITFDGYILHHVHECLKPYCKLSRFQLFYIVTVD